MREQHNPQQPNLLQALLSQLALAARLERKVLILVVSYALAIALFSLIIPLTVQELVSTFSYAIQPVMVWTLTGIMGSVLLFVGIFKAFQFYAVEMLQRRLFARVAISMVQRLPQFRFQGYKPQLANYFTEAVYMQRALSAVLINLVNVVVGGTVGMILLVIYHPYFLVYDMMLMFGFVFTFLVVSRGAMRTHLEMSHAKYDVFNWIQEISQNLLHLKATDSQPWLMQKTDDLVNAYTDTRKARFAVLLRQFMSAVGGMAIAQAGALAIAGWLLSDGAMTLGQLVAVEVVVGALVLNFESLIKSMAHVYYFFTGVSELNQFFSTAQDEATSRTAVPLPPPSVHGLMVTCKGVGLTYNGTQVFENFNLEVAPGEKVGIYARTPSAKMALSRVLAGLEAPSSGVVQYNGVDVRYVDPSAINRCRSLVLDSQHTLMEGTIEENIVLGRPYVSYDSLAWALRFTELEELVEALPRGIKSNIGDLGEVLAPTHIVQILLARAILGRPQLLIFDGLIHSMDPALRETILRRLCSKQEPWSAIFVSTDPNLTEHTDRRVMLHHVHA
jgi:ABC-type bacteriocin/lantibiotic exporter with double-glycine peptidase domain